MIVIAILNASVPYLVRETMNTLTHQYQVNFVIYSLLFSGAYGLCCTSAQVFEWLKRYSPPQCLQNVMLPFSEVITCT